MPVSTYTGQVSQAPSTQLNFRSMIGEILGWNPDIDPLVAGRMLNNSYRRIIDYRSWYGLMIKGLVTVPNAYTTGTVSVTNGSATVTGTGTAWTVSMIGQQFRCGFSFPIYTIVAVDGSGTSLTLDNSWSDATFSSIGYQIFQNIVSPHPNLKSVLAMVNQKQGYRLKLHVPQEVINIYDTWRTTTGWTFLLADAYPSPKGWPQFELYPAPTFLQAFPFLGYIQPPDMVKDADFPVVFIRADLVVTGALHDALLFRGKNSKYYDPATAKVMKGRFDEEMAKMALTDDNLAMRNLCWEFEKYPMAGYGAQWQQTHDIDSFSL